MAKYEIAQIEFDDGSGYRISVSRSCLVVVLVIIAAVIIACVVI